MHVNNLGQQCEGVLCTLCTRCSACHYQKPGTYKQHEHTFVPLVEAAKIATLEPKRTRSKRAATL